MGRFLPQETPDAPLMGEKRHRTRPLRGVAVCFARHLLRGSWAGFQPPILPLPVKRRTLNFPNFSPRGPSGQGLFVCLGKTAGGEGKVALLLSLLVRGRGAIPK